MQAELTAFERIALGQWLGGGSPKGNIDYLRRALRLLDKLELTEEERAQIGYQRIGNSIMWKDARRLFAIELDEDEMAILRGATGWDGWPVSAEHLAMLEKLERL